MGEVVFESGWSSSMRIIASTGAERGKGKKVAVGWFRVEQPGFGQGGRGVQRTHGPRSLLAEQILALSE